jgi:hypothetical protein
MKAAYPGICKATGKRYAAGTEIEKGKYGWQIAGEKPADRTPQAGERRLVRGSGYGHDPYREGEIFLDPQDMRYVVVRAAWREYYREDGLSFGVGDDSGYLFFAVCRVATVEEYMPVWEEEQKVFAAKVRKEEATKALKRLFADADGVYEFAKDGKPWQLEGDWIKIGKGFNIYGGGEEFCVAKKFIWRVLGNGADGDNWSRTNTSHGIGYRFARTKERLAALEEYVAAHA